MAHILTDEEKQALMRLADAFENYSTDRGELLPLLQKIQEAMRSEERR